MILHYSVNKACIDRVGGLQGGGGQASARCKILDTQEGKGTTEGARPVMRDLLGRFPDLDAVFPDQRPERAGLHLGHRVGRQARAR